jgi:phospholipase C
MPSGNQLSSIQHVVVLMLENRSFDTMLGFLYTDQGNKSPSGQPFEGLTGKESNPDSSGKSVRIFKIKPTDKNAYYMPGADPGEGYAATNNELFGSVNAPTPAVATNKGFVKDFAYALSWEEKKPSWAKEIMPGTVAQNIMGMYTTEMLPVLSALARGYAVCDHWHCSLPTETMPNRAFVNAATSQGQMDDKTKHYTVPSIFGLLEKHNVSWTIYGYDKEPLTRYNFPDTQSADDSHFGLFKDFQAAAAAGTLSSYTFLEPEWSSTGNSQHPAGDVAPGEQLIHDVYYALRNGKAWNQTLLIVTYDEHGGCYDHVPPPSGAVPPDDTPGEFGFDFKRFGIRVPAVLISPLIEPGIVFRVPAGTMPLDHTSILKTVEKRWKLPALTARDAAAPDLGDVLTRATPRTDDPLKGVKVPKPSGKDPSKGRASHLEKVHAELVSALPVEPKYAQKLPPLSALRTSADHKAYIEARIAAWKKSRDEATKKASGQSTKKGAAKKAKRATKKTKKKS